MDEACSCRDPQLKYMPYRVYLVMCEKCQKPHAESKKAIMDAVKDGIVRGREQFKAQLAELLGYSI